MTFRSDSTPRAGRLARSIALSLAAMLAGPPVVQSQPPAPVPVQAPAAADAEPSGSASAFEGYRAHADEPIRNWKQANDEVGRIGGWRAYAREASAPDSPRRDANIASPARTPERENPLPGAAGHRPGARNSDQPANIRP